MTSRADSYSYNSPPGAANSGKLFNSGVMSYSSTFQYTFDQPGIETYHCEIHPWMTGSVYVSDSNKQGNNFKLRNSTSMGVRFSLKMIGSLILLKLIEFCLIYNRHH